MPDIPTQLQRMLEADQAARRAQPIDWDQVAEIDTHNTKKLKQIIKKYGWITISKFGKAAARNAFLLVQHADQDLQFQAKCLKLMTNQPEGEAQKRHIAMLTDRVLIKQKGVQRYGTQLRTTPNYSFMLPVEDLAKLDELRAEMDLEPIQEYFQQFSGTVFLTEVEAAKSASQ